MISCSDEMSSADYFFNDPSNVSKIIVTKLLHLGHLICLKAWILSYRGLYIILKTLVINRDSSPDQSHDEHVYVGFTFFPP